MSTVSNMSSVASLAASFTWSQLLSDLLGGQDQSTEATSWAMDRIMSGEATPAQTAGFLVALRAKGETQTELRGLADQMLAHAHRFEVAGPSLDIVGTGGDRAHTVNISTTAAIICAAAGVTVVKHGNRAASSSSGSADVLEALGVDLTLDADRVAAVAGECGITFCFAQVFHPGFRHSAAPRKDLGIATALNFLGPLTNPAQPTFAAVGVADRRMAPVVAGVFAARGRSAVVFRGDDGLDELTISTTSTLWWVDGEAGSVTELTLDPQAIGIAVAPIDALRGGDAAHNAQVVRQVFAGERGPIRDAVLLNAGIALALADGNRPTEPGELHEVVRSGMGRAAAAIDSGAATGQIDRWVTATARFAGPDRDR